MKVAIPLFGKWISPRFGFSMEMWILSVRDGKVITQKKISMAGLYLSQWFNQLYSLGIDTLICGGIDGFCYHRLTSLGISIIPEVSGEAKEALNLFLKGKLQPGFRMGRRKGKCLRGTRNKFFTSPWETDNQ